MLYNNLPIYSFFFFSFQKKAYKAQKKSHKKALKYGLPVAGLGLGAYALHKGFHHRSSSSSSSSSSSEEE
jgi:hypothetical protein